MGLSWKEVARAAAIAGALCAAPGQARQVPAAPSPANAFRLERFAEDWSAMADEAARTQPWHGLKWIDLGGATLTLGGDLRVRGEFVDSPMFGATGAAADGYLMRRAMVHADVRLSPALRGFVQVSHHDAYGRKLPFPLDRNGIKPFFANLTIGSGAVAAVLCHESLLPVGARPHRAKPQPRGTTRAHARDRRALPLLAR